MTPSFSLLRPGCMPGGLSHFVRAALLACGLLSLSAEAATVTNTAQASFNDFNGIPAAINSNTTSLSVLPTPSAPTPGVVTFYRYSPTGQCGDMSGHTVAAQNYPFNGGRYADAPLPGGNLQALAAPMALPPLPGQPAVPPINTASAMVCPTTVFHTGEPVFVTLADANRNIDPYSVEVITLKITSSTGDTEELELRETGPNTGVFSAVIQSEKSTATNYNGKLSVDVDSTLTAHYEDVYYPADQSDTTALVDPFGLVFDAVTGNPISAAVVRIVNVSTGADAKVYRDDGVTPHPASMVTGSTVPGNPAVPPGGFRFPLVAPGTYRFEITLPAGYSAPSLILPACAAPPCANTFGRMIVAGSHLDTFVVVPGPALNIDIPVDPTASDIVIQKTVSQTQAAVGDFLQYRLTVQNRNLAATNRTTVTDMLPAGMRYQAGSLYVDGVKFADPVIASNGRTLTFEIGAIAAGATAQVSYVVVLGAGVVPGQLAVNAVSAVGASNNITLTSNRAQVGVLIREDMLSSRFTIIGRVFESDCKTAWQDLKGLANALVMLEDGTYVVTDADGQYHIEGVKPGTHVVQLDTSSLPAGYEAVPCIQNSRFAGSAYSQFVDVKGGGLWRADFFVRPAPKKAELKPEPLVIPDGEAGIRLQTLDNVQVSDLTETLAARSYTFKGRFDPNQDVLRAESVKELERLLAQLQKGQVQKLEIIGHTDSAGLKGGSEKKFGDNYGLSRARAKTIADYLGPRLGLAAEQIVLDGRGPDMPVASNDTLDGRARNRRVEVIVHGGMGPTSAKVGERSRRQHRLIVDTGRVPAFNLRVTVMLPADLAYVKGSARIDDAVLADPEDMGGMLVWRIPAAAPKAAAEDMATDPAAWQRLVTFNTDVVRKVVTAKPASAKEFQFKGHFEPNHAELMPGSDAELQALEKKLAGAGAIEALEVIGHTDSADLKGDAKKQFGDNYGLSQARARTIADALSARLGLSSDRITVSGKGPDEPVASNKTLAGRAQNRRVEVRVHSREAAQSHLQNLCTDGNVSLKAAASIDTEALQNVRLPVVENQLACADINGRKDKQAEVKPAAVITVVDAPTAAAAAPTSTASAPAAVDGNDSGRKSVVLKPAPAKTEIVLPAADAEDKAGDDSGIGSAGAGVDWLQQAVGETTFLFPAENHNPRAPALRVVVAHQLNQSVSLFVNGEAVSGLNFDGERKAADRNAMISAWRGVPLVDGANRIVARVRDNASGQVVTELVRVVHYANTPVRAELIPEQSKLVADGITRPVLAIRLLDRDGKPIRNGVSGPISITAPYMTAQQLDETQQRQLAGLDRYQPQYTVKGDDGIALIELAPTTESGMAKIGFTFQISKENKRTQELQAWMAPAARDWVMVGFAEGSVGFNTLKDNAQALKDQGVEDGSYTDGKVSFYAKGRVLGKWLLTMAYDSSKSRDRQGLLSTIDPNKYYTLYGDGAQQRYDAASQAKLYLKLERGQFYALFGDYETGLTQTQLTRYSRVLNGFKSENAGGPVVFTVYAADTEQNYAHDEIQGNGTSGLYRLKQRGIVLNSEIIRLEVRDRLASEKIISSKTLARHLDYDIDYDAGTLFFKQPVNARDTNFNPAWIVVEYETLGSTQAALNAGGRIGLNLDEGKLSMGVTALRDEGSQNQSNLGGADLTYHLAVDTELRLEVANSTGQTLNNPDISGGAWLAELEHHSGRFDALLYSRRQDSDFGVSQQSLADSGQQKTGVEGQYRIDRKWAVQGQVFQQENQKTDATRDAVAAKLRYETENGGLSVGAQVINDSTDSGVLAGQDFRSEQAVFGANRWFMKRKVELTAQAEVGQAESADYPNRYVLGAGYQLTDAVRLLAAQEFTDSDVNTSTSRVGAQVVPWKGARVDSTLNQSQISEFGPRTFAQMGLTQTILIDDRWGLDFSVDSSRSLNGAEQSKPVVNSDSTTNLLGTATVTAVTEDYLALSGGATYRSDVWSWNGRLESRNGDTSDRYGITSNFLRQAHAGVAFATSAQVFHTLEDTGSSGNLGTIDLSWAWRPLGTQFSVLDKLEFKYEDASNSSGIYGFNSLAASEARTRRIINNLALNHVSREWTGEDMTGNLFQRYERTQWSLYYGAKYALDTFDGVDYSGYTDILGLEVRHDIKTWLDIGLQASTLNSWSTGTRSYSFGPQIGGSPVKNGWVTLGWNLRGFSDKDFDAARYSAQGPYLQLRFKFDQNSFKRGAAKADATNTSVSP
ncbi:MAG: OmpA family protein [Moraxellaceae bacterium]